MFTNYLLHLTLNFALALASFKKKKQKILKSIY